MDRDVGIVGLMKQAQPTSPTLMRSSMCSHTLFDYMEALTKRIQLEMLEADALKLTTGERAAFAPLLLASLDEDAQIEEAWATEVERRIAEVESGAVQLIPISGALFEFVPR